MWYFCSLSNSACETRDDPVHLTQKIQKPTADSKGVATITYFATRQMLNVSQIAGSCCFVWRLVCLGGGICRPRRVRRVVCRSISVNSLLSSLVLQALALRRQHTAMAFKNAEPARCSLCVARMHHRHRGAE